MEICDINEKEFKVEILKVLKEMQENTCRKLNALRRQMNEQKEYRTGEIEYL